MNCPLPNPHTPLVALMIFLASSVGACAPPAENLPSLKLEEITNELLMPGKAELIDLTHPLSPDSLYWPTGSRFEHQQLDWGMSEGGYWYEPSAHPNTWALILTHRFTSAKTAGQMQTSR